MGIKNKYMNKIYDGRWKAVSVKTIKRGVSIYTLENIYNHETMEVETRYLHRIENGETTISRLRAERLNRKGIVSIKF